MTMKSKKNKKAFFGESYSKSWKFLKDSRNFIYAVAGVFFVFALLGFFVPTPDPIAREILKIIEEIVKKTEGMSGFELIRFIFFNNLQSSFMGIAFGIAFGIFPVLFAIFNGYLLGFVASMAVEAEGGGVLWRIFPHGIFELPAVFISLGMGLRIGIEVLQHNKFKSFKNYLYEFARVFILIVVPLLIIAAIIEGSLIFLAR